jgi:phosphotransferase system enzyme I (PtsI)
MEVFKTQLRALLRAGVYGNLRIMLPLVTRPEELTGTLRLIQEVQDGLSEAAIPFQKDVPVGIMVETPATALMAGTFAKHSVFFSIGTNDLTQYTLAIDRENPVVAPFFNEFHPGVLRLIHMTVESAQTQGIGVSVCGEMAGSADGARLLAGLGVRSLSVSPRRIVGLKSMFAECTLAGMESFAREMLAGVHLA